MSLVFVSSLSISVLLLTIRRGESGVGNWRILVKDTNVNGHKGTFINWRLNLWGQAINGSQQSNHPLPGEHEYHGTEAAIMTAPPYMLKTSTHTSLTPVSTATGTTDVKPTVTVISRPAAWTPPTSSQRDGMLIYVVILALATALSVIGLLVCNCPRFRDLVVEKKVRSLFPRRMNRDDSDNGISASESDSYPRVA